MLFLAPSRRAPRRFKDPSAKRQTRGAGPRCATEGSEAGNHGRSPAPRRVTLAARESRIGQVGGTCGRPGKPRHGHGHRPWHGGVSAQAWPATPASGGAPRGAARRGRAPGSANSAARPARPRRRHSPKKPCTIPSGWLSQSSPQGISPTGRGRRGPASRAAAPPRGLGRSSPAPSHARRASGRGPPGLPAPQGTAAVAAAAKEQLATGRRRVRAPSLHFAQWREIGAADRAACDLGGARARRGGGSARRGPEGGRRGGGSAGVGRGGARTRRRRGGGAAAILEMGKRKGTRAGGWKGFEAELCVSRFVTLC